jgi:hypothetical protein
VPRRSRHALTVAPPAVEGFEGFERVESIKALGVTISRRFSVAEHVDNLLAACAQTLFALRTLRQYGLPTSALQTVFEATVVAKLAYASPARWGFVSAADKARIEAFLRRSVHFGYRADSAPTFAGICAAADDSRSSQATRGICFSFFCPLHEIIITNYGVVPVTIFSFLSIPQLFVTVIFL